MKEKHNYEYEDRNINESLLERYPASQLTRVLVKKIANRVKDMVGINSDRMHTVNYNGVTVFGTRTLDGEGTTVGQDYIRILLELGLKRCHRIYEYCSGPGYIGYSLLANGFCEKLTLADINPKAVEMLKKTAQYNGLEDVVNIYQSECLDQIPTSEKWDLVVSNPPHFLPRTNNDVPKDPRQSLAGVDPKLQARNLKAFDPDWSIHRRFYEKIKNYMAPGGYVVLQENGTGSKPEDFIAMIENNGGKYLGSYPGVDRRGRSNHMYYMVSRWNC